MKTCATCGKRKQDKSFRKDGRYKDNLSSICETCRHGKQHSDAETLSKFLETVDERDRWTLIDRVFGGLPTVDIEDVPILAEGGPYFGTGSPPEGDFFSKADLELFAEQTNALEAAGELRPPSKLGHSEEQRLLNNSGLPVGDELPAAGWLTNFHVGQVSGVWKLLCDVKQVPAKLGQILASGGYRTRSVELSKVTSQKLSPGTQYDGVVTGLAWLGAKAPAVRTLDDVWNLYAEAEPEPAKKTKAKLAVGDVVWEEEQGIMDLISDLTEAINEAANPDQPSYMWPYWVSDVNLKLNQCVVDEYGGADASWIVGFKVGADNEPTVQPRDQWVPATMKLVEIDPATLDEDDQEAIGVPLADDDEGYTESGRRTVETYAAKRQQAREHFRRATADTKGMKLTDEQIQSVAKTFGIEGEGDELRSKVEAHLRDALEVEAPKTEETKPVQQTQAIALSSFSEEQRAELTPLLTDLTARAERGDRAYADHFAEVRNGKILRAMEEGRLNPADREKWVAFYDAQPELASKMLAELPPNPLLLLTMGDDADGLENEAANAGADAYLAATGADGPVGVAAGGDKS